MYESLRSSPLGRGTVSCEEGRYLVQRPDGFGEKSTHGGKGLTEALKMAVLTPISSPLEFSSGPPLFPASPHMLIVGSSVK